MREIEEQRNIRWQVLFKLYELHRQQPGTSFSAEELKQVLPHFDTIDIAEAVTYLSDKGLVSRSPLEPMRARGVPLCIVRISGYGIDQVEGAMLQHKADLKKRPVGFETWHIRSVTATGNAHAEGAEEKQ